jgi:hypothetical protein
MQIFCDAFFCEFELEIEKIKKVTLDPINQAKEILEYIQLKLKELFKWLKNSFTNQNALPIEINHKLSCNRKNQHYLQEV